LWFFVGWDEVAPAEMLPFQVTKAAISIGLSEENPGIHFKNHYEEAL
jgi:hypothetical protein